MKNGKLCLGLLTLFVLSTAAFAQGLYWEQTTKLPMGGREIHTTGQMKSKKLRTSSDADNAIAIVRGDKEIVYTINPKEKTYSEMTFAEVEAMMSEMTEQLAKVQEQLKDLPPEQRKMLEGLMGGTVKERDGKLKSTGEKKTIAGYSCEKVILVEGDEEKGTFWVAKDASLRQPAKDWSMLMDRLAKGPMAKILGRSSELDGFLMESTYGGISMVTTRLEKQSLDDAEFEVPAGYRKVEARRMRGVE
jgi:hypothetical protein